MIYTGRDWIFEYNAPQPFKRSNQEILLLQSQGKFLTPDEKNRIQLIAEQKRKRNKKSRK